MAVPVVVHSARFAGICPAAGLFVASGGRKGHAESIFRAGRVVLRLLKLAKIGRHLTRGRGLLVLLQRLIKKRAR